MARDGNDEKSVSNFCFFSDLFLSNIELNALAIATISRACESVLETPLIVMSLEK